MMKMCHSFENLCLIMLMLCSVQLECLVPSTVYFEIDFEVS